MGSKGSLSSDLAAAHPMCTALLRPAGEHGGGFVFIRSLRGLLEKINHLISTTRPALPARLGRAEEARNCPQRGFGHRSSSRQCPNAAQSSNDSKFWVIFLLLTSFAVGQTRAACLRTWKPERSRGDRKS